MPITATQTTLVILGEQYFDHGYLCGRSWYFHGDTPERKIYWKRVIQESYFCASMTRFFQTQGKPVTEGKSTAPLSWE